MRMRRSIIVAMSENRAIGKNNALPWHIPEDFAWFKKHTSGHPVIMGRKTFDSIGKLLPGRKNIIVSRQQNYSAKGASVYNSLEAAIDALENEQHEEIFVIGGYQVFNRALAFIDRIYLTLIHRDFDGDIFFPPIPENIFETVFEEVHDGAIPFTFYIYDRVKNGTTRGDSRSSQAS
jgi:dihydrofolate reductase